MAPTQYPRWQPFLGTLLENGMMELTFPDVPQEIDYDELIAGVRKWVVQGLISQGIVSEIRIRRDNTVEISCTTRELLDDDFGDCLKIWDDPYFYTHLNQSFSEIINDILSLKYS